MDRPAVEAVTVRGARELAAVVALGILLTIVLTYPLAFRMGSVGRVQTGDGQFSIWNVAWVARTLVADPGHLFDANIFYPHTGTLAYSEANLGAGFLGVPGYWLTRNAYVAHNSAVLIAFVLCFAGAYYLARYLTRDRRAAVVSAVCYTFCPYVFARTAHVQLMMTLGLPYTMLAFHRLADRPTMGRGAALGAAMAATTYFCAYYGVFALLTIGFAVLTTAALRRLWRDAAYWTAVGVAAVTAVFLILPLFEPYAALQGRGFGRSIEEAAGYAADWRTYLTSSARLHTWIYQLRWIGKGVEVAFPGFVAVAFAVVGIAAARSMERPSRNWIVMYAALAGLALWVSLGPDAGLYAILYRTVPGFTLMRAPGRFGLIVTFALSVLAAFGVRALLATTRRAAAAAAVLTVLTVAELSEPLPFVDVPRLPSSYATLASLPAGPVIEMPFFSRETGGLFKHTEWMLYSTRHWKPLLNGYSDYIPPDYADHQEILTLFPTIESMKLVAPTRVRYAVFHRHRFTGATWTAAMERLRDLAPYFRLIQVDNANEREETRLYEILGFP